MEGNIFFGIKKIWQPIKGFYLACIAHKSLEIFERCRLRQQNPSATPDNSAAFCREESKGSLFRFILLLIRLLNRRAAPA
jgi:hypothetical protein